MNALVNTEPSTTSLQFPKETASVIKASIAEDTLKAYHRALKGLETRILSDEFLAAYITVLHDNGKSPATIGSPALKLYFRRKHLFEFQ